MKGEVILSQFHLISLFVTAFFYVGEAAAEAVDDPALGIIIDNEHDAGYREIGTWKTVKHKGAHGKSYRVNRAGSGADEAIFTPVLRKPGTYKVYVKSSLSPRLALNVRYRVYHADGVVEVTVEKRAPSWQWTLLGAFKYQGSHNIKVVLSDYAAAGKLVAADAVSFVFDSPLEITVDNHDQGFLSSTAWKSSRRHKGYAGRDYKIHQVSAEMDVAKWQAPLPDSGKYEVFARWTAAENRTAAAPYLVFHRDGVSKVTIDQSQNGNKWVSLGVYDFQSGAMTRVALSNWTARVALSNWTGKRNGEGKSSGLIVVADAVKFVFRGQVNPFVKIETPDHMSAVPNPVTITFRAGGCVQKVRFRVDGELLQGAPLSVNESKFTYTFRDINRAHQLTLIGYDAHGNEVAEDQIVFTPERPRTKAGKPDVQLTEGYLAHFI